MCGFYQCREDIESLIFISYITSSLQKSLESANVFSNTATGAPYLRKSANLAIREISVIT